jgi:uncharacterized protein
MKTIARRLTEGQDLLLEIERITAEHQLKAGVVLSAVGSLHAARIRMPVLDGGEQFIEPKNLEIISLQGTISAHGCHLHIAVSGADGVVLGGHLKQGCIIRTTCELVIGVLDNTTFDRRLDSATGFNELVAS